MLDVDEIKYVPKGIDRAGRVEMLVDVGNQFKPFPIEATLLNEQVRNRGLAIKYNEFFPPNTGCGIGLCSNQLL